MTPTQFQSDALLLRPEQDAKPAEGVQGLHIDPLPVADRRQICRSLVQRIPVLEILRGELKDTDRDLGQGHARGQQALIRSKERKALVTRFLGNAEKW